MRDRLICWYQQLRIAKYRLFSDCKRVSGKPILRQPVQMLGLGRIVFHGQVNLGYFPSSFALSGYVYLEARTPDSVIEFGDNVWINNNTAIVSNGPGIFIGGKTMIGGNCEIVDSDFHNTHPNRRMDSSAPPRQGKVVIGENVMIGSNVKILKGVKIGNNSVVGNGSVVVRSIPANMMAMGNPVKCGPLFDPDLWAAEPDGKRG